MGIVSQSGVPLSVDRTRIVYHGYVGNPEMWQGAGGDLDKVEIEDQEIVGDSTWSFIEIVR